MSSGTSAGFIILAVFTVLYLLSSILDQEDNDLIIATSTKGRNGFSNGRNCTISTCLELRNCVLDVENLRIYLQPLLKVIDNDGRQLNPEPSAQFLSIRKIIQSSRYFTSNPSAACLVIPGIDTLSTSRYMSLNDLGLSLQSASEHFPEKSNFLVFNFFGSSLAFGDAIVASPRHLESTFRRYFDIAIPALSFSDNSKNSQRTSKTKFLLPDIFGVVEGSTLISKLTGIFGDDLSVSSKISKRDEFNLHEAISNADFVIISEDLVGFEHLLIDALKVGAVPVIFSDLVVLPYDDIIDWSAFSFTFVSSTLEIGIERLKSLDPSRITEMKSKSKQIYDSHFDSIEKIVLKTLGILELKLVPSKTSPKREIFEDFEILDEYLITCDYFIPVILHRFGVPEGRLQWILRYFLYAETNASMALIFTEKKLDTVFSGKLQYM